MISRRDWGTINFETAKADINSVLSIAKDLSDLPLQHLTDASAQTIINHIPPLVEHFEEINEFSLEEGDPSNRRDNLCRELHEAVERFHSHVDPLIPYLAYKRGDIADNIEKLNNAVGEAERNLENAKTSIAERTNELDKIVQAAREAAASAGVATFTGEFDSESINLRTQSEKWLVTTIVFVVLTIFAAIGFYFWPPVSSEATPWEILRNVFSKAAIIAVLFTGTVWCGRIYRALIHQAAVNRHRALSLKTFQAFVRATDDPFVRDAVLMAATRTVFGSVPTGLVEHSGGQDAGLNFFEYNRSAGEKAVKTAAETQE